MRFLAYGPICLAAGVVVADSAIPTDMTPEMLQGGVLAVLGWTIYYVLVKVFPAHEKAQREQRDAFLKLLKDLGVGKDKGK